MGNARKPRCTQRIVDNALGREQTAACFNHASQRIVMAARIVHRCPEHALDVEFVEAQGWSAWLIEEAS